MVSKGRYVEGGGKVEGYRFRKVEVEEAGSGGSGSTDKGKENERVGKELEKAKWNMENIGTIRVFIHHVKKGRVHDSAGSDFLSATARRGAGVGSVNENEIKGKAVTHSVDFAPAVDDPGADAFSEAEYVDMTFTPAAVYEWRYRSHEGLQEEGIIPRDETPTAAGTPEPTPIEELTHEEALEEVRRLRVCSRRVPD